MCFFCPLSQPHDPRVCPTLFWKINLVDVSDIFSFFCSGEGKGESEAPGEGGGGGRFSFLGKIPGRGGLRVGRGGCIGKEESKSGTNMTGRQGYWTMEMIGGSQRLNKYQHSTEGQKAHQNLAPAQMFRNAPSTAGNSMTDSERPSPEPLLKKEASPAVLGGREFWKCSGSLKCLKL